MSYILDALRKSESERRQGRVPDLGQQVQFVHKPKKKKSSLVAAWIGVGLLLNAVVLAVVFWQPPQAVMSPAAEELKPASEEKASSDAVPIATPVTNPPTAEKPEKPPESMSIAPEPAPAPRERPTIIVPSPGMAMGPGSASAAVASEGQVPHLLEMPLAFQKSLPDLVFNSHIYASEPSSRRVMINNNYLKAGQSFDGIRVQKITEDGVVLSKNGRSFRVGIVSNWVSPD